MIDRNMIALRAFKQRPHYWIALLLPIYFAIFQLYLRSQAGPFWQWNLLDPSYFYLFDGLNLLNGDTPGHVYHPGVTVHAFNAILIWLHELITSDHALPIALHEPERYLYFLSDAVIILNSLALVFVGLIGHRILGSWLPALICQLAPFTSSIILKHAFLPKPEALLVFSTIAIISLSLLTLRDGLSSSFRDRLGIGFGIILGFIFATKVTAAPMFLLPLFLLRKVRPILIFSGVTIVSFALFFLPAWGAAEQYLDWLIRVVSASGPYGSGSKGTVDVEKYFSGFVKILKRPSLRIPMVLALLAVGLTAWRSWNGWKIEVKDIWIVLGVSAVQLGQTIVVAKQPTAFYMIPSYMLASLSLLFSIRIFWHATPHLWRSVRVARTIGSLLFAGLIAAQTWGLSKLAGHLEMVKNNSMSFDNNAFKDCARIYNYAASSPVFAAYLADYVTGTRFSGELKRQFSENEFWIDDWWDWESVRLKNWDGEHDIMSVIDRYPCVLIRGTRRGRVSEYLKTHAKGIKFNTHCSKGAEIIRTYAVDCSGRPIK